VHLNLGTKFGCTQFVLKITKLKKIRNGGKGGVKEDLSGLLLSNLKKVTIYDIYRK